MANKILASIGLLRHFHHIFFLLLVLMYLFVTFVWQINKSITEIKVNKLELSLSRVSVKFELPFPTFLSFKYDIHITSTNDRC